MKRKNFLSFVLGSALLGIVAGIVYAAATYDATAPANNNQVVTIATGSTKTITLNTADYTFVHLNIQDDGTTASASTDYVVIMNQQTPAGVAVSMDATYTDSGNGKFIVAAGAAATFAGSKVPAGSDGPHEIQIKAVGHGCKANLICGK